MTNNKVIDAFSRIAPPLSLINWLEAHQEKHSSVPAEILAWMDEWRRIRGEGTSAVDGIMPQIVEVTQ